jgi:hypothetical protein
MGHTDLYALFILKLLVNFSFAIIKLDHETWGVTPQHGPDRDRLVNKIHLTTNPVVIEMFSRSVFRPLRELVEASVFFLPTYCPIGRAMWPSGSTIIPADLIPSSNISSPYFNGY